MGRRAGRLPLIVCIIATSASAQTVWWGYSLDKFRQSNDPNNYGDSPLAAGTARVCSVSGGCPTISPFGGEKRIRSISDLCRGRRDRHHLGTFTFPLSLLVRSMAALPSQPTLQTSYRVEVTDLLTGHSLGRH
jgi:hypothetical protein